MEGKVPLNRYISSYRFLEVDLGTSRASLRGRSRGQIQGQIQGQFQRSDLSISDLSIFLDISSQTAV